MRDVGVVAFAQHPNERATDASASGVEMLVPLFQSVLAEAGLEKNEIGFWCSGSSDYVAGRAFSFVMAIDAIGAWPPIRESHVEMDGAWALYEAWVKIQTGEVDTALVYGFGKSSAGELRRVLTMQLDPYTVGPLWPDSVSLAALQARAGLDGGKWSERDLAEVAARSRRDALDNPNALISGDTTADALLEEPFVADPLRKHDCAPITDGAAAVVLAAGDVAREACSRPAWIRAFEHRIDSQHFGARNPVESASARAAAHAAGVGSDGIDVAELYAPFTHQELLLRVGSGPLRARQPVGRRAVRQSDVRRRDHARR